MNVFNSVFRLFLNLKLISIEENFTLVWWIYRTNLYSNEWKNIRQNTNFNTIWVFKLILSSEMYFFWNVEFEGDESKSILLWFIWTSSLFVKKLKRFKKTHYTHTHTHTQTSTIHKQAQHPRHKHTHTHANLTLSHKRTQHLNLFLTNLLFSEQFFFSAE